MLWRVRGWLGRNLGLAGAGAIILFGLLLYWPALSHELLTTWDDPVYVTNNPLVHGLSKENFFSVFARFQFANYTPLTLVSYMVDYSCWGLAAKGFILTNLLLHLANALLVFVLLRNLAPGRAWPWAAALLFLVHPVQVESVVWISQRKTVLSTFFLLIALWAYVRHRAANVAIAWRFHTVALIAAAMALLAKPLAAVVPLLLVAFELSLTGGRPLRRRLLATLPFFVLAAGGAVVTVMAQAEEGVATGYHGGSLPATVFTMLPVLVTYARLTVWPVGLSAWYDVPIHTSLNLTVVASAMFAVLLLALGVLLHRHRRGLFFWYAFFFVGLAPVSQMIPLLTLINDRYLYLPLVGASALAAAVFLGDTPSPALSRSRQLTGILATTGAALAFISLTHQQIPTWRNSRTLWDTTVRLAPNTPVPYSALAYVALNEGDLTRGIELYAVAISLIKQRATMPGGDQLYTHILAPARFNTAMALLELERVDEAIDQLRNLISEVPNLAEVHFRLGHLLTLQGDTIAGLHHVEEAVRLRPDNAFWAFVARQMRAQIPTARTPVPER